MLFINAERVAGFEEWIYAESTEHMSPVITAVMKAVSYIGDVLFIICLSLLLFAIPKVRNDYAIPVSSAIIVSTVLNLILKSIIARTRPDVMRLVEVTNYSFPSGHAMVNMALYSMIVLLIHNYVKNVKIQISAFLFFGTLVTLIGFSRIYLGAHYVTDVIAGWCMGLVISVSLYHLWKRKIYFNDIKIKESE